MQLLRLFISLAIVMNSRVYAGKIPEVATNLNLTTLVDLVVKANLADTLEGEGPITVFGPTNEAFDNLPEWAQEKIQNITVLTQYLTYHVLAKKVISSDLSNELLVDTVEGRQLRVNIYDGKIYTAQCAPIDLSLVDQMADNGVIHVLNSVMIPPYGNAVESLSACPKFKTLVTAVAEAGLVDTLSGAGPFTIFAPNDEAFAKLPTEILERLLNNTEELKEVLLYHVVAGTACSAGLKSGSVPTVNGEDVDIDVSKDGVKVNEARVISPDGSITNGVVHAIDTVLLPKKFMKIPEVAAKLNLTTLVDLVVEANLADTLEGEGPFTVFGPTNEAFKNLPEWAQEKIQNITVLTQYLTYHVLAKEVISLDLSNELLVDTVEGRQLRVNIYDEKIYTAQCAPIDLSLVDQMADNGVIHVLNSVMIPPYGNAVETLSTCPKFKTLVTAVVEADLVDTLSGAGPFTIFAPNDEAFAKLPTEILERLLNNKEELKEVLLYHVVVGTACSAGLKSGPVPTVNGENVDIEVSKDGVKVNEARVISPDGSITNGVVHAIDTVLLPKKFMKIPEVAAKLNLTTLVDLVVEANLADTLEGEGPFTVFGPTNEAFENLPAWVKKEIQNITVLTEYLTYHVLTKEVKSTDLQNNLVVATVAQKPLRINIYDDKIFTAQCAPIDLSRVDQAANNGVIHVLNSVMIPPAGNAVEALTASLDFTTLVTAVVKAGLVDTLSGKGPYTVFAPNNEAFGKIPEDTLKKLLNNPDELREVLLYHVVPGTACSAGLKSGTVATVNGQNLHIRVSEDGVQVNDAKVIYADASITNGVFHTIDTVLMPNNAINQSISLVLLISLFSLTLLQYFSN